MPSSVENSTPPRPLPEDGIADRLRIVRERLGLTQAEFALRTKDHDPEGRGVSRTVLVGYESGKFKPGARELRAICDAFKVTPQWLLYGSEATDGSSSAPPVSELTADPPDTVSVFTIALSLMTLKPHERQAIVSLVHALSSARKGRPAQQAIEMLAWHMAVDAEERLHVLSDAPDTLDQVAARRGVDLIEQLTRLYETAHGTNYTADKARLSQK